MDKRMPLPGLIAVVFLVALALVLRRPEWRQALPLPDTPFEDERRNEDARARSKALDRRSKEKTRIVLDLLDGRLTLFEAAAVFDRLNREFPALPTYPVPGDSEGERTCWQVIRWAEVELQSRNAVGREAIIAELAKELKEHKERYGTVLLPPVGSLLP
jgi:hypothetical protein